MSFTYNISLNTIEKVKNFINITSRYPNVNFDLKSGRYIIDGKSIMGIFSLNLDVPIEMTISSSGEHSLDEAIRELNDFFID